MVRQQYVNLGYAKAIAAVKKQDDRAVAAADKVQQRADDCAASWWDVISQAANWKPSEDHHPQGLARSLPAALARCPPAWPAENAAVH